MSSFYGCVLKTNHAIYVLLMESDNVVMGFHTGYLDLMWGMPFSNNLYLKTGIPYEQPDNYVDVFQENHYKATTDVILVGSVHKKSRDELCWPGNKFLQKVERHEHSPWKNNPF